MAELRLPHSSSPPSFCATSGETPCTVGCGTPPAPRSSSPCVVCTPEQRSAVEMAARDVAEIREQLPAGSLVVDLERDQVTSVRGTGEGGILDSLKSLARGKVVNATSYKL